MVQPPALVFALFVSCAIVRGAGTSLTLDALIKTFKLDTKYEDDRQIVEQLEANRDIVLQYPYTAVPYYAAKQHCGIQRERARDVLLSVLQHDAVTQTHLWDYAGEMCVMREIVECHVSVTKDIAAVIVAKTADGTNCDAEGLAVIVGERMAVRGDVAALKAWRDLKCCPVLTPDVLLRATLVNRRTPLRTMLLAAPIETVRRAAIMGLDAAHVGQLTKGDAVLAAVNDAARARNTFIQALNGLGTTMKDFFEFNNSFLDALVRGDSATPHWKLVVSTVFDANHTDETYIRARASAHAIVHYGQRGALPLVKACESHRLTLQHHLSQKVVFTKLGKEFFVDLALMNAPPFRAFEAQCDAVYQLVFSILRAMVTECAAAGIANEDIYVEIAEELLEPSNWRALLAAKGGAMPLPIAPIFNEHGLRVSKQRYSVETAAKIVTIALDYGQPHMLDLIPHELPAAIENMIKGKTMIPVIVSAYNQRVPNLVADVRIARIGAVVARLRGANDQMNEPYREWLNTPNGKELVALRIAEARKGRTAREELEAEVVRHFKSIGLAYPKAKSVDTLLAGLDDSILVHGHVTTPYTGLSLWVKIPLLLGLVLVVIAVVVVLVLCVIRKRKGEAVPSLSVEKENSKI